MKKKIAILGSTGSIGDNVLKIIKKDKKNFEITLLTANKNYKELIKQAEYFKVRYLITFKVFWPIDPVDPKITIFFFIKYS